MTRSTHPHLVQTAALRLGRWTSLLMMGACTDAGAADTSSRLANHEPSDAPEAEALDAPEAGRSAPPDAGPSDTIQAEQATLRDASMDVGADAEPARLRHLGFGPFGIAELYPSAARSVWTAEHWRNEGPYTLNNGEQDEHDPSGLSGMRGAGSVDVSPVGELVLGGERPRFYVLAPEHGSPWRDIEITVYYRRLVDDDTGYAGLVIGTRTAPEGHGESPCEANTYYSRLRHDGATDFEKELMHPPSSGRARVAKEQLWPPTGEMPIDEWIGWKFVIYNTHDDRAVKLESYRDMTNGVDGGDWELVNETLDDGGWTTETNCAEHAPVDGGSDMVALDGGAVFIGNTGLVEARYKWFSIREIISGPVVHRE